MTNFLYHLLARTVWHLLHMVDDDSVAFHSVTRLLLVSLKITERPTSETSQGKQIERRKEKRKE